VEIQKNVGYVPDINNPRSYCEKIQWLKLNHSGSDSRIIKRTDKYAVRRFVEEKGFGKNLVQLYGFWDTPKKINWDGLPEKFVLKMNNASGQEYLWFVESKSDFPIVAFLSDAKVKFKHRYGYKNGEFKYSKIPPKIIAEQYLKENNGVIKDYKFYCFHGNIKFLSVEVKGKAKDHVHDYFTTTWGKAPVAFRDDVLPPKEPFKKPKNFEVMIKMAKELSEDFPHVRVDMYNVNGNVYFGELTYTPENGMTKWQPQSLDFKYGKLMDMNKISSKK